MPIIPCRRSAWLLPLILCACAVPARTAAPAGSPTDASTGPPAVIPNRAAPGEDMAFGVYYIKPEKREQYERFIHEVFWPMGRRLGENDPVTRRVFQQTRVLHPKGPNEDGTYTYGFLFDPVVPGGDYSIESNFRQ